MPPKIEPNLLLPTRLLVVSIYIAIVIVALAFLLGLLAWLGTTLHILSLAI